jgi:molybdate transport system permease protein
MTSPLASDDFSILRVTLQVAAAATVATVPVGTAIAWLLSRPNGPMRRRVFVQVVTALPLVLPPSAVGLLLLEFFRKDGWAGHALSALGIELLFTWKAAALASFVMSLPLVVRSTQSAFEQIDPDLLAVARTLGLSPLAAFFRVAVPLSWRGIGGGALLGFCRALGEFGATILVAGNIPGSTQTIALAIFQRGESGRDSEAMRLVWIAVAIAVIATALAELARARAPREPSLIDVMRDSHDSSSTQNPRRDKELG